MRLVLGSKTGRYPHPTASILKVYIEAFTGFSNVHYPGGLNNICPLKAASLQMAPTVGTVGRVHSHHWRDEEPADRSTGGHDLSMTSTNTL